MDTLPVGLQFRSGTHSTTCGPGSIAITNVGANPNRRLTLTGGTLGAGLSTCTITVYVIAPITTNSGTYNNNIGVGALTTGPGGTGPSNTVGTGNVPVTVRAVDLAKAFSETSFQSGDTITMTITLQNYTSTPLNVNPFIDNLPAGLSVPLSGTPSTNCPGGSVAVDATRRIITLSGGTIPAGTYSNPGTCSIIVPVTGTLVGGYTNTIPVGRLTTAQGPSNRTARSASVSIYAVGAGVALSKAFVTNPVNVGSPSMMTLNHLTPCRYEPHKFRHYRWLPCWYGCCQSTQCQCGFRLRYRRFLACTTKPRRYFHHSQWGNHHPPH